MGAYLADTADTEGTAADHIVAGHIAVGRTGDSAGIADSAGTADIAVGRIGDSAGTGDFGGIAGNSCLFKSMGSLHCFVISNQRCESFTSLAVGGLSRCKFNNYSAS